MNGRAPTFFCPIPTVLNPHVDAVERQALAWLAGTGICPTPEHHAALAGTNSAEFYARITPAATAERLLPAVDWCYWGFAFDDRYCDEAGAGTRMAPFLDLVAQVVRVVQPFPVDPADTHPYVLAAADIAGQFRRITTPTQMRRWANAHYAWLTAAARQMSGAAAGRSLTLADYLAVRLDACAGEPTTAMIEMVMGAVVPPAEMDSPTVLAATESARMVAALDNDLVSRHKEYRLGQAGSNVVDVIAHELRCGPDEALQHAIAIRDRIMALFLRLRDRLRRQASEELLTYVDGLAQVIRGNIEWSLRVPRYGWEERVQWSPNPSDDNPDPIPASAISWWWQQLN